MGKTELMALGTIVKFLLGLVGVVSTMVLFFVGLIKKDNERVKRAGLFLIGTCLILLMLTAIEFLFLANK